MIKLISIFILQSFFLINLLASTLNLSMSSSPSRLNPILTSDKTSSDISDWIFNGLLKYDKNGNIVTDLAMSYEFEDEKTLIFKLRKDVLWHDGKKFTAEDVLFTYKKIIDKNIFTSIKSNFKEVESVEVIDKYTLKVKYKRAYFKALVIWMFGVIPKHILENDNDLMTSSFNKKPIGTGPYRLTEFNNAEDIELVANPTYFRGKPYIDKILYKFLPDTNTSFLMLKKKQLDLGGLTPLQIDRQIDEKFKRNYKIIENQSFFYDYLGFNLRKEKFKNPKVREALSLAINRKEIVDILYFGYGKVCTGPFLPGNFAFNDQIKEPKQNINKAIKLLKEAGYDNKKPFSFEIATNTGNEARINAAQIIQYQLSKIGVDVKLKVMEWQAFLNTIVYPRNFESILLGWSLALMPDAYPLWHSNSDKLGGFNLVGYHNDEVDKLIEKGSVTIDLDKLSIIYKKLFKIISNDNPYLFLYIPSSITAVNSSIKNIEPSLIGIMHNEKDWIKP